MSGLTYDRLREVLDYNEVTGVFTWKVTLSNRAPAGSVAGVIAGNGYRYITIDGEHHLAHRLAWLYTHGAWPDNQIDHRRHGKAFRDQNQIANLREVTNKENVRNTGIRRTNTSGVKGVSWDARRQQWFAKITYRGFQVSLGCYDSKEEAGAAYARADAVVHCETERFPETHNALTERARRQTRFALQRLEMKLLEGDLNRSEAFWEKADLGISKQDYYTKLNEQKGLCGSCGEKGDDIWRQTPMSLEPDFETTGDLCGLLCARCKDGVDAIRHYREYHAAFDAYFEKHGMTKHIIVTDALKRQLGFGAVKMPEVVQLTPKESA